MSKQIDEAYLKLIDYINKGRNGSYLFHLEPGWNKTLGISDEIAAAPLLQRLVKEDEERWTKYEKYFVRWAKEGRNPEENFIDELAGLKENIHDNNPDNIKETVRDLVNLYCYKSAAKDPVSSVGFFVASVLVPEIAPGSGKTYTNAPVSIFEHETVITRYRKEKDPELYDHCAVIPYIAFLSIENIKKYYDCLDSYRDKIVKMCSIDKVYPDIAGDSRINGSYMPRKDFWDTVAELAVEFPLDTEEIPERLSSLTCAYLDRFKREKEDYLSKPELMTTEDIVSKIRKLLGT